MEDIDGELHPAVDGQSLDEDEDELTTKLHDGEVNSAPDVTLTTAIPDWTASACGASCVSLNRLGVCGASCVSLNRLGVCGASCVTSNRLGVCGASCVTSNRLGVCGASCVSLNFVYVGHHV